MSEPLDLEAIKAKTATLSDLMACMEEIERLRAQIAREGKLAEPLMEVFDYGMDEEHWPPGTDYRQAAATRIRQLEATLARVSHDYGLLGVEFDETRNQIAEMTDLATEYPNMCRDGHPAVMYGRHGEEYDEYGGDECPVCMVRRKVDSPTPEGSDGI